MQTQEKADKTVFIRALLLIQSLQKGEETSLINEIQPIFLMKNISTDSRSQIALFMINELKAKSSETLLLEVLKEFKNGFAFSFFN